MKAGAISFNSAKKVAAFALCLVMALAFMLPLTAHADESTKTVRIGWYESPFNMMDEHGRRSGYAYEYQAKIAAYTGWDYEYVEGSWPELMQMLIDGKIDLMSDVSYTPDRAQKMLYGNLAMGTEEYYVFVTPDNTSIRQDDPLTLNGKIIGVNKGSIQADLFRDWAEQYGVHAELVELTSEDDESFQMVLNGDLDAYLTLDAYGGMETAIPVFRVGSSEFFFVVNKDRPDLLKELNAAMSRIQGENRYFSEQLSREYITTSGANLFLNADELDWLDSHGAIRVGYQDGFAPFCEADGTGQLTGALKDYLDLASSCFSNAHLNFEPVAYPTATAAMEALKAGKVDCMFPSSLSTSEGEAMGFVMTPAVMSTDVYAVVRNDKRSSFSAEEPYTVAMLEGDPNYDSVLLDDFPNWTVERYPDMQACLKAVSDGKADCTLISNYQYNSLARSIEQYGLAVLAIGEHADFYFAVNRGDDKLYSILTKTTNLVSSTTVDAALNRNSYEEDAVTVGDFVRDNPFIAGAAAAALLALIIIIIIQRRLLAVTKQAEQSRHEVEDLSKQVFVDALTHVRNKGGFDNYAQEFQERLDAGESIEFAVVVCDINGLKSVNDLHGHKEGDACIKEACSKVCRIFSHSPVFRVGGDEFVIVLTGEDYDRRLELVEQANAIPGNRSEIGPGETVSAGMAVYDENRHSSFQSVLEEADRTMYERKQSLKESVTAEDEKPGSVPAPEYISAIDVRKCILIVDDVETNREIMGDLLGADYEISYASDGDKALEMLRSRKGEIDLVILDLLMPNKDGREVLAEMQVDENLMSIPAIVLTVDQDAELDCLKSGAMDFIPKPYPDAEIVKARIDKCIELAEDRELIRHTERDKLTGLLNRDYFFRYVSRLDHIYKDAALDAVVCDVNHFYPDNKQYGRQFGDLVLRIIGTCMRKLARKIGGIGCRQGVDTFLLYCPRQDDYEQLIQEFTSEVLAEEELADKVSMRFGVFANAQQEADIEERFVRAKIAADRVKDDPQIICGYYDLG